MILSLVSIGAQDKRSETVIAEVIDRQEERK
jgi:hypothetical protein